jgi:hypothetical protein
MASQKSFISKMLPHSIAVILFLVLNCIYFAPQLEGKKVYQSDIISFKGAAHEVQEFKEKTGEVSLWTNSMFGGMPTYQIYAPQESNLIRYIEKTANLFIGRPIGYFFASMICFYIMLIMFGVNPWVGIIGALAFGLTTNTFVLFEAGHATKVRSLTYFSFIVLGVILTYRKRFISGGLIFTLGMALNLYANHVQMTFYLGLCLLIYLGMQLFYSLKDKEVGNFFKSSVILLLGMVLAIGSTASKLLATYEYSNDTMRGEPILEVENKGTVSSSSEVKGLEWGYAMQWSNGTMDVMSAFIPGIVGGGSQEPVSKESKFYKDLTGRGAKLGENPKAPLYWGDLPFTSGPGYFGATILLLFLLGAFMIKGRTKWWLVSAVVLTLLMSMGKNFPINKLFFDYLPMFNKFRSPNSVLTVTSFLVPILATLILSKIYKGDFDKEELLKKLMISTSILGGLALVFMLFGSAFFDFSSLSDGRYKQSGYCIECLEQDRISLMRGDAFRSLALVLLVAGVIWAFVQSKMKHKVFALSIGALVVFDLWGVAKRYLDEDSFISKRQYEANFTPRKVDRAILQDKDPHYRVFDLSINTFNASSSSYFHKTIGGYHAAKLQRYQDMIDRYISKGDMNVLNMLNTKYIITRDQKVQKNAQALGNAWFVDNIKIVQTPNEEIAAVGGEDMQKTAVFLEKEFPGYMEGFNNSGEGSVSLTDYKPNALTYKTNTNAEKFLVFSEVWYGPDKGWTAYIDGKEAKHVRVDYVLRGMRVPKGNHTIEFKFEPRVFITGERISLICSLLIILLLIGYVVYVNFLRKDLKEDVEFNLLSE